MAIRSHNAQVCGLGWDTDCDQCRRKWRGEYSGDDLARKNATLGEVRQKLQEFCTASGVDFGTLVDVLWMEFDLAIEKRVEQYAGEAVKRLISEIRLVVTERGEWKQYTRPYTNPNKSKEWGHNAGHYQDNLGRYMASTPTSQS